MIALLLIPPVWSLDVDARSFPKAPKTIWPKARLHFRYFLI